MRDGADAHTYTQTYAETHILTVAFTVSVASREIIFASLQFLLHPLAASMLVRVFPGDASHHASIGMTFLVAVLFSLGALGCVALVSI